MPLLKNPLRADQTRISRRAFVGGVAVGAAGAWGLSHGLARFGGDPARPLKGNHKADIVIIGGGFVFTTINPAQPDAPPENLRAMWETLQQHCSY